MNQRGMIQRRVDHKTDIVLICHHLAGKIWHIALLRDSRNQSRYEMNMLRTLNLLDQKWVQLEPLVPILERIFISAKGVYNFRAMY